MSIKRRKLKKPTLSRKAALLRMGDLLAAGHGTEKDVETYNRLQSEFLLDSALGCIAKAEKSFSWDHMHDCYKQASEIFVLASVLYEKNPNYVIMSDGAYDGLAKWMLKHRGKFDDDFWNWYNITSLDLKAGTGHKVTMQAPVLSMYNLYLHRNGHDDNTRVLRRPAKRTSGGKSGTVGKPVKRVIRRSGRSDRTTKIKTIKRDKHS